MQRLFASRVRDMIKSKCNLVLKTCDYTTVSERTTNCYCIYPIVKKMNINSLGILSMYNLTRLT